MNNENFEDLKQFIDGRIGQSEENIIGQVDEKITVVEGKITGQIQELRLEMHEGFAGVGEAIDQIHTRIDGLEDRVETLEKHAPKLTDQAA